MLRAAGVVRRASASPASSRLITASHSYNLARRAFAVVAAVQPIQSPVPNSVPPPPIPALHLPPASAPISIAKSRMNGWTPSVPSAQPDKTHESSDPKTPTVFSFFEKVTATWQYIAADMNSRQAVVIDPVLDYDPASGTVSTKTADSLLGFIRDQGLTITHILETHAHADHLTSSQYFKTRLGGDVQVCIGARIAQVQQTFAPMYGFDDPSLFQNTFDMLLKDDQELELGSVTCRIVHLPGHTPDHVGYVCGGAIFTGDSIFNPDVGSARADFPGGNAKDLYSSVQRLLSFPENSLLFVGHDYPPTGRGPVPEATIREHKDAWSKKDEVEFIQWRQTRDASLGAPRLLHPSLQVNIRAGKLPPKDANGRRWFKTPLKCADVDW